MEETKDGGPAFPSQQLGSDGLPCSEGVPGMSLRDYFAGQALISMGQWAPSDKDGRLPDDIHAAKAKWAYEMADALLAARGGQHG